MHSTRVLRIAFANWTLLFDSENTLTNYTSSDVVYLFSASYQYMNAMSVLFVANLLSTTVQLVYISV